MLQAYSKQMFRPECNPTFESLHCHAHLEQDIAEVLPYLNAVLGGFDYNQEHHSLTLRVQGKLITLHPRLVAINALKDEQEAEKIMAWLQREINQAWDDRADIEPDYQSTPRPKLLEVLKLLPMTNCKKCGQATCMVFASQLVEGGRAVDQCPELAEETRRKLGEYLGGFFTD